VFATSFVVVNEVVAESKVAAEVYRASLNTSPEDKVKSCIP
jgi:hypothetical protein